MVDQRDRRDLDGGVCVAFDYSQRLLRYVSIHSSCSFSIHAGLPYSLPREEFAVIGPPSVIAYIFRVLRRSTTLPMEPSMKFTIEWYNRRCFW